jgi:hypothetical protein
MSRSGDADDEADRRTSRRGMMGGGIVAEPSPAVGCVERRGVEWRRE